MAETEGDLEHKMSTAKILCDAGITPHPSFYSGRGATLTDLNSSRLERVYELIRENMGEEAAKNYVQMVSDIPVMSATDFLLSLENLETHKWKWSKNLLGNENGTYVTDEASCFGTLMSAMMSRGKDETRLMMSAMMSRGKDETHPIKDPFLRRHGVRSDFDRSDVDDCIRLDDSRELIEVIGGRTVITRYGRE